MDTFDEALDSIMERALATNQVMVTLGNPPYGWHWTGESSGAYNGRIGMVEDQVEVLSLAEAATSLCAGQWDAQLDSLLEDARLGVNLGRFKFRADTAKLKLCENLTFPTAGRDKRYKQLLAFEAVWQKADPAWVFKTGLTLAIYSSRREALVTTFEPNHVAAETNEKHQRAILHFWADELNEVSVQWYAVATSTFAEDTVPGQLIRTIPTTYNPNRPPGELIFTTSMSTGPNSVHLLWRAARGERFYILAQAPDQPGYQVILDGVSGKEWIGLGLTAGLWKFKGYATNAEGTGEESEVIELNVANANAA
jgi:hypothetical protein